MKHPPNSEKGFDRGAAVETASVIIALGCLDIDPVYRRMECAQSPSVSIWTVRPQCLQWTASGSWRLRPQSGHL